MKEHHLSSFVCDIARRDFSILFLEKCHPDVQYDVFSKVTFLGKTHSSRHHQARNIDTLFINRAARNDTTVFFK